MRRNPDITPTGVASLNLSGLDGGVALEGEKDAKLISEATAGLKLEIPVITGTFSGDARGTPFDERTTEMIFPDERPFVSHWKPSSVVVPQNGGSIEEFESEEELVELENQRKVDVEGIREGLKIMQVTQEPTVSAVHATFAAFTVEDVNSSDSDSSFSIDHSFLKNVESETASKEDEIFVDVESEDERESRDSVALAYFKKFNSFEIISSLSLADRIKLFAALHDQSMKSQDFVSKIKYVDLPAALFLFKISMAVRRTRGKLLTLEEVVEERDELAETIISSGIDFDELVQVTEFLFRARYEDVADKIVGRIIVPKLNELFKLQIKARKAKKESESKKEKDSKKQKDSKKESESKKESGKQSASATATAAPAPAASLMKFEFANEEILFLSSLAIYGHVLLLTKLLSDSYTGMMLRRYMDRYDVLFILETLLMNGMISDEEIIRAMGLLLAKLDKKEFKAKHGEYLSEHCQSRRNEKLAKMLMC